ncbi:enolase-like [Lycium barbarum]|uniref:enolase-like n=1 Tax=Lycium barbarum TaxID=112863 RepID=UPI00293E235E|nr:enolase-like [Lycium barbarum]
MHQNGIDNILWKVASYNAKGNLQKINKNTKICRALAYIHNCIGICHRDIKLQNLLVDAICLNGVLARASVPSGASTGVLEALELTDGESDYLRNGVSNAVNNVNTIIGPALIGKDSTDQTGMDHMVHKLDGKQKVCLLILSLNLTLGFILF